MGILSSILRFPFPHASHSVGNDGVLYLKIQCQLEYCHYIVNSNN